MPKPAMSSSSRVPVPEVLPVVMPQLTVVPEFLPAPPPQLVLPRHLPADLPPAGRAALAAALAGDLPARKRPGPGELIREAGPCRRDDAGITRLRGFLRTVTDLRSPRGRSYPLEYLLALPVVAGMAGERELDAVAERAATAPAGLLARLGAPLDRAGEPRRPDATTIARALGEYCDQDEYDRALCARTGARARALRPGMRRHLRIDGKAVRGAAPKGGRVPMLLSGLRDDGTVPAQLVVNVKKTNEITVAPKLLRQIPAEELKGTVATLDQMHTQKKLATLLVGKLQAEYIFTIGGNQPRLFDAADALPWTAVAGEAWTAGRGRIDVRTIKTLPPNDLIRKLFPHVEQVFLIERYSYAPDGTLLSAVAVLGITSLAAGEAGPADLLAYLRGHWAIEMHHYVRDVVFGEDASRTGRAHRAMAAVRNTVIGALRLLKIPNIAAQLRANHRDPYQLPLLLLGLMTPLDPNSNPAVT